MAAAARVRPRDPGRVAYAMQTTLAVDEAESIADVLRRRFPALQAPRRDDICYATTNRQQAVRAIARDCDLVLVVGSPNSSNSLRLVEVAEREGVTARLVDDRATSTCARLAGAARIGITAGASAPPQPRRRTRPVHRRARSGHRPGNRRRRRRTCNSRCPRR